MKHKTKSQLAKELGISRETLRRIAKFPGAPANLDTEAWRSFYARHRVQPMPGATVPVLPEGEPLDGQKLDYQQARTLRTIYAAERERVALEQARGSLVAVSEVKQLMTKLATNIKMRLMQMPGQLPPILEGRTAAEIEKILDERVRAVLNQIADYAWNEAHPAES